GGANTGGTDIIAQILNKYTPLSLGTCLIMIDAAIIFASMFVFGIESALYAVTTVYITGYMIDKVALPFGANTAKTVLIISDKYEDIAKKILAVLDHGVTMLEGKGMYTGADRPVLMSVIPNNEIIILKRLVHDIDDKAFMIVQNANQVLGEGFTPISKAINMQFGN
ncbi:MAG: YitT family protein, partial [Spirochaetales bacterium]|nr:YitT family protein [Spirochaetales bacterium]